VACSKAPVAIDSQQPFKRIKAINRDAHRNSFFINKYYIEFLGESVRV